ncbi:hypothetical protein D3C86_1747890 [compost metagenome]
MHIHFRNVMQRQFIELDGRHQVIGDGHAFGHLLSDLLRVEVILIAAHFLGAVQRHVRLAQQAVGVETGDAVATDTDAD